MSTHTGYLRVVGTADVRGYETGMRRMRTETKATQTAVAKFGGAITRYLAPAAIGYGLLRMSREVESFQQELYSSIAIMGKVSDAMRTKLIKIAQDVAYETKFSAKETAAAYYYLTSAGMNVQQSVAALPTVAKFAQAGMFDLSRATDLLAGAQSALGLKVADTTANLTNMARVGDVLVKANILANASVEEFAEALTTKSAASARAVKKPLEEVVAVLAVFADQKIKAAEAGTAYAIVMRDLQTKAIQNAESFERFGVVVYDASGNMRPMWDIVADLEKALAGMSDETQKATLLSMGFSDKSLAFQQTLLGTSEQMRAYNEELKKAGGTMSEVAGKQLPPLTEALQKVRDLFSEMSTNKMTGPLERLGILVGDLADGYRKLAKEQSEFVEGRKAAIAEQGAHPERFQEDWFGRMHRTAAGPLRTPSEIAKMAGALSTNPTTAGNAPGILANEFTQGVQLLGEVRAFRDAQKEQTRLAEEEAQKRKRLADEARRIADDARRVFESTLNPFERFTIEVDDLRRLLDVGAIGQRTFDLAEAAARDRMMSGFETPAARGGSPFAPSAAEGSAEAYRTIMRALHGQTATDPAQKTRQEQLAELRKSSRSLEEIKNGLAETVEID